MSDAQVVARDTRMAQLEDALMRGFTNREQLAAKFGVSRVTITHDIYELQRRWKAVDKTRQREKRRLRIRQLESILQKSLDAFDKSRGDSVETTTQYRTETCGRCEGKKVINDDYCSECDGEGIIQKEIVTQKVTGSPGDVAYLNAAKGAIAEIAKIEGISIKPKTLIKNKGDILVSDQSLSANPYLAAPAATLQAALSALHALRRSTEKVAPQDGTVIEGKVLPESDDDE